jgi:DNA-binding transcriptional ArsR family regulator
MDADVTPLTTVSDQDTIKALGHPLRVQILGVLDEREASPRELSDLLEEPLGNVSYHVRTLAGLGFLRLARTTARRGAIEHHYELVARPVISDAGWATLPNAVKNAVSRATLTDTARDIQSAARDGGFQRSDVHLSRTPVVLDEEGWAELSQAVDRLLADAARIEKRAVTRLKRKAGEAFGGRLVMMLFDTPSRRRRS